MMKPRKAAKSASDIGLRGAATGGIPSRSAFPKLRSKKTYTPKHQKAKGGKDVQDKGPKKISSKRATEKNDDKDIIDAEVVSTTRNVSSTRVNKGSATKAIGSKPKALPGPKKQLATSKKDKTKTVFVAEPKVVLDEGPDFGKITHDITKTKQPVSPRQFR